MRRPMKNSFNNAQSGCGTFCSLCQDTLLRHIGQGRIYWYCPSCRQEMVGEGKEKPAVQTNATKLIQPRKAVKIADYSKQIGIRAS